MALTEYRCSGCGKISGDSESPPYNETHVDPKTSKTVKCDTNGPSMTTLDPEDSN